MRIIDKTGKLYRCLAWYPIADPESGHVYQPGEFVRVDPNKWIAGQTVMQLQEAEKPVVKKQAA